MKKIVKRKTKINAKHSILILIVSFLLLIGTSVAFFADMVTSDLSAQAGTVRLNSVKLLMEQNPDGDDTDYVTNMLESEVLNWNPGDVNTIEWTVENEGNKSIYTKNILSIAWDTTTDLSEQGVVYLYPTNMSDAAVRLDINNNNAENAIYIGKDNHNIVVSDIKTIKGYTFEFLGDTLDGKNIGGEIGDSTEANQDAPLYQVNDNGLTKDTLRFKLAFALSAPIEYQNKQIYVKVVTEAIQFRNNTPPTINNDVPDTPSVPDDFVIAERLDQLNWAYPSQVSSSGSSMQLLGTNEFRFQSSGIQFVRNGIYTNEMIGKNVEISVDIYQSPAGKGSIPGIFIQLRRHKSGDTAQSDSTLVDLDYYGVIYDGSKLKIVKSESGSLISKVEDIPVAENTLGTSTSYYNVNVKTIGDTIYAELRDSSGSLAASSEYTSADFDNQAGTANMLSYNWNVQYKNIKARAITAVTPEPPVVPPIPPATPVNIIAFGDSNTYGNSLPSAERESLAWPGQINSIATASGLPVTAINKGTTYHTSANLLSRLSSDVYANKVDGARNILIIYIGTNDFNQLYSGYASAFTNLKNNIETMRSGAVANGFEVWLVTFPICADDNGPGQGRNPGLRAYNDWIINDYYGTQNKVPVVIDYAAEAQHPDLADKLKPEHLASDGLHASAYGHNWIARQVLNNL
jgi:Lysophospholipase L1 and related esterases